MVHKTLEDLVPPPLFLLSPNPTSSDDDFLTCFGYLALSMTIPKEWLKNKQQSFILLTVLQFDQGSVEKTHCFCTWHHLTGLYWGREDLPLRLLFHTAAGCHLKAQPPRPSPWDSCGLAFSQHGVQVPKGSIPRERAEQRLYCLYQPSCKLWGVTSVILAMFHKLGWSQRPVQVQEDDI